MAATTTQLTPNSQSVVTMDAVTAQVSFQVLPTDTPYWSPQVSTSFNTVSLGRDVGNATVTFKNGLTVSLNVQQSGGYTVLLDGQIVDGNSTYTQRGRLIGTFTPA